MEAAPKQGVGEQQESDAGAPKGYKTDATPKDQSSTAGVDDDHYAGTHKDAMIWTIPQGLASTEAIGEYQRSDVANVEENEISDDAERSSTSEAAGAVVDPRQNVSHSETLIPRVPASSLLPAEDRKCSVEKSRETLFNQLIAMMPNGRISDIRLITLLSECGDEIINKIKPDIKSIRIDAVDLPKNDQMILASMIKQCSPLDEVYIQEVWLDPPILTSLKGCHENVSKYQVGYEIEDTVSAQHIPDIIELLETTKPLYVILHCEDEVKNEIMRYWMTRNEVGFNWIGLINLNSVDTLQLLFALLEKFRFDFLQLGFGENISANILCEETSLINSKAIHVRILCIRDKSLTTEKLNAYLKVLLLLRSTEFAFYFCNLNNGNLAAANSICRERHIELAAINIRDKSLPADGYGEVASTVAVTKCSQLNFIDCDLDKSKLSTFRERCKEIGCQIEAFQIRDKQMNEDGYGELASTLKAVTCSQFVLDECDLTETKVHHLWKKCLNQNVQVATVAICDNSLPANGFREVASTAGVIKCKTLIFGNCHLNKEKLSKFCEGCKEENVQIETLRIRDEQMNEDGYGELASTLKAVTCSKFVLDECDLTETKLHHLWKECLNQNVQVATVEILDNSLPANGFREVASTAGVTKCKTLFFGNCHLDKEKLSKFTEGCKEENVQLSRLYIFDGSLAPDGYKGLANVLHQTKCPNFVLHNCKINKLNLQALIMECKKLEIYISKLWIANDGFLATDDVIEAVCQLMRDVVVEIEIIGWVINDEGKQRLRKTLHRLCSEAMFLKLPDGKKSETKRCIIQ